MCAFPIRCLFQPEMVLQAVLTKPLLATIIWGCKCVLSMCLLSAKLVDPNTSSVSTGTPNNDLVGATETG
jgi:hypothetical protein